MTHEIMRAWAEAGIILVAEYVAWVQKNNLSKACQL
jgi:hypothetical protein